MNLDDYSYEFEDRRYLNPQVSLDEQNAFINNLRNSQVDRNAEIARQTYALGTQTPSSLGGLAGGSGYFRSRYQTPQINSMISDLRAAAQAQALTTLLQNEIDKEKKRYKKAANAANNRATNPQNQPWTTKTEDDGSDDPLNVEYDYTEEVPIGGSADQNEKEFSWLRAIPAAGLSGLFTQGLIPVPGAGIIGAIGGGYLAGKGNEHTLYKKGNF